MSNLLDFRKLYPLRPHMMVIVNDEDKEVISYPYEDDNTIVVKVRTKDDPTTIETVKVEDVYTFGGDLI